MVKTLRFSQILLVCALFSASCGVEIIGGETTTTSETTTLASTTTITAPAETKPTAPPETEAPTTTTTPANFADAYELVADGVFRVEASFCDGGASTGTGFLISENEILTAAHVIGDAKEVDLSRADGTQSTATVVGTDESRDLALLEVDALLGGHIFTIDDSQIRVGDEVAALGHPRALNLSLARGVISSLNYFEDDVNFHQTDAPINPGNSGGPLIDVAGNVVGLADWKFIDVEGISFVVAASEIRSYLDGEKRRAIDISLGCETEPELPQPDNDPDLITVAAAFEGYLNLINESREGDAYDTYFGPRLQERIDREEFIESMSTSFLTELDVYNLFMTPEGNVEAWVSFTSFQEAEFGPDGQTCSLWDLTYEVILQDNEWKLHKATNSAGSPSPC